jgi:cytochrome c oxidase subunit 2
MIIKNKSKQWRFIPLSSIWFQDLPEDISLDGYRIDNVIHYTDLIISIYFGIVVAALLYFIIRYRASLGNKAVYDKGDKKKNIIITACLGLLVFLSVDAVIEAMSFKDLREAFWNFPDNEKVVRIEVMPQQFAWNFRYPGPDKVFGNEDDIIPAQNQMHIPINRPVVIQLASWDVIHSFYLPNFRIKQDATPGMITALWFQATKTGVFDIACAELCGNSHYKMLGYLTVEKEEDFEQWLIDNSPEDLGMADEWDEWDNDEQEDAGIPEDWGWAWKELK